MTQDGMTQDKRLYIFTQIITLTALILTLTLGLLPALLGGLLVYFIVEFGAGKLERVGVIPQAGKIILLILVSLLTMSGVVLAILGSASYLSDGSDSFVVLLRKMADIVETGRSYIPAWIQNYVPMRIEDWQQEFSNWLRHNARYFSIVGQELGMFIVHVIFGMIIGGMIAIRPAVAKKNRPLAKALNERVSFLSEAFHRIVFSQIRISALNTFLTGIFLVIILPLFGFHLPLTKTMIAVTFFAGLLPIIGNLISNTVIFLIALSVSPIAAVGSLAFLIIIHKLEYFFNAHIIGTRINARAWELLLAMLVMEAMFGMAGLVAAPIYYAYIKDELSARKLI